VAAYQEVTRAQQALLPLWRTALARQEVSVLVGQKELLADEALGVVVAVANAGDEHCEAARAAHTVALSDGVVGRRKELVVMRLGYGRELGDDDVGLLRHAGDELHGLYRGGLETVHGSERGQEANANAGR